MHLRTIQPPKRTARARGLARRVQEAECLLINQLDPEVQGFSDGGQLSHSLHAERVGFVRVYRQADAASVQQIRCYICIGLSCVIWHGISCKNYE